MRTPFGIFSSTPDAAEANCSPGVNAGALTCDLLREHSMSIREHGGDTTTLAPF